MIKIIINYFAIVLVSTLWFICKGASAQSNFLSVDSLRYSLIYIDGNCFIKDSIKNTSYKVPPNLLKEEMDTTGQYEVMLDMSSYLPSLAPLINHPIKSFKINDSITGLFMTSFYDLEKHGTTGNDYIFYLNHKKNSILDIFFTSGLVKFYTRPGSCYQYYILSDLRQDGTVDLGIIKENYRYNSDPSDSTVLKQEPIKWFGFGPEGYKVIKTIYTKTLPEQYSEITINDRKPNDFLMGIKFGQDWLTTKYPKVARIRAALYFTPAHRMKK